LKHKEHVDHDEGERSKDYFFLLFPFGGVVSVPVVCYLTWVVQWKAYFTEKRQKE